MRILEYKQQKDDKGVLRKPGFILDGGYFHSGNKLIGLCDDNPEYYLPPTSKDIPAGDLIELTRSELITRMQTIGMSKSDGSIMTDQEILDAINLWCDSKNVA